MINKNMIKCSVCGERQPAKKVFEVDGKDICVSCIYGDEKPFEIYPIGYVRNDLSRKDNGFGVEGKRGVSIIELGSFQKRFLYKIKEESVLTIIYYLHKTKKVRSVFKRGLDGKKVGVFSSRTPYRLSKLAVQNVELVKAEGRKLYVKGLDAIDGSPVVDIKMGWG